MSSSQQTEVQPLLTTDTTTSNKVLRGYIFAGCSAFCQSLVTFLVHYSETVYNYPPQDVLVIRSFTSLILSTITLLISSSSSLYNLHTLPWPIWARGFMGGIATIASFSALSLLPVGTAVTLFYLSPALTTIFASIFIKDTALTIPLLCTILLNFIGISLVSRPSLQSHNISGVVCAIIMAFASSSVFILQRFIGRQFHFAIGVFSYGIGCLLCAIVWLTLTNTSYCLTQLLGNTNGLIFALVSGLAGFGSQSFLNLSLQTAPAGPSIVVRSMNIPFTLFLGYFFLNETVGWITILGVAIVLISIVTITWLKLSTTRKPTQSNRV